MYIYIYVHAHLKQNQYLLFYFMHLFDFSVSICIFDLNSCPIYSGIIYKCCRQESSNNLIVGKVSRDVYPIFMFISFGGGLYY